MINAVRQEIGEVQWNGLVEVMEWDPLRMVLYLLSLTTLDKWNNTSIENVKGFLERMWLKRNI